jgi:hypothetical protein
MAYPDALSSMSKVFCVFECPNVGASQKIYFRMLKDFSCSFIQMNLLYVFINVCNVVTIIKNI